MAIGDDWAGSFSHTSITPGSWTVFDWSSCLVLIDKINIDGMKYCENTNNINFGAGNCLIKAVDADRSQYLSFKAGNEIEIYMSTEETANKVWGGYITDTEFGQENGNLLTMEGFDYSSKLKRERFTDTYSGVELSEAVEDILSKQSTFTYSIPATSSKTVSAEFTDSDMFTALQKLCNIYGYFFWVDVNKVARLRPSSSVVLNSESIVSGTNVSKKRYEKQNRDSLCNKATIRGSGGTEESSEDATSQSTYGLYEQSLTVESLSTAAAVQAYANQFISDNKDQKPNQSIQTKFLATTEPRNYSPVTIADLGLSGNYQIVRHTRKWGEGVGISSEIELSNNIADSGLQMGEFERRITDVEKTVF